MADDITTFFRIPYSIIRRMLFLIIIWSLVCIVFFCFSHTQDQEAVGSSVTGRDQDATNYAEFTTPRQSRKLPDLKGQINNNPTLSEKEVLKILLPNSNIPFNYWKDSKPEKFAESKCFNFPNLYDLDFNNVDWQKLTTCNSTFYLFGAYYDRIETVATLPIVGIMGMVEKIYPPPALCQFWYDDSTEAAIPEPLMNTKAYHNYMWYNERENYRDGVLQPFIIIPCKED